ncbi:MAG: FHA domain-containing protein, partial [Planctomycetia bacterium]
MPLQVRDTTHQIVWTFPEDQIVVIGRGEGCDIQLNSARTSSRHAVIVHEAAEWRIYDLRSSNGTVVNDMCVLRATLRSGDALQIGDHDLVVQCLRPMDDAAPATNVAHQETATLVDMVLPRAAAPSEVPIPSIPRPTEPAPIDSDRPGTDPKAPPVGAVPPHPLERPALTRPAANLRNTLGSFEIIRQLHKGSGGVVYLADWTDHDPKRLVALKVFDPSLASDEHHMYRFCRGVTEASKIQATLKHPGLLRLYRGGRTKKNEWYLV